MKIIINESQLRLIVENEEYISSIKELINTFEPNNIEMAFHIMDGMEINPDVVLNDDDYKGLFKLWNLEPSKENLMKMIEDDYIEIDDDKLKIPLKLLNLPNFWVNKTLRIENVGSDLDDLVSFDGNLDLNPSNIVSLQNLTKVGGWLEVGRKITSLPKLESVKSLYMYANDVESLPNLEYVGEWLILTNSGIKSLPKLKYVGKDLDIIDTPLSMEVTETELRNIINVKGYIFLEEI